MLFCVRGCEVLQPAAKLLELLGRVAKHHAERVLEEEARAGHAQHELLLEQLLAELDVVLEFRELFEVDAHHHVDRTFRLGGRDALDALHRVVGCLRGDAELLVKALEEGIGNGLQNSNGGELSERAGVHVQHGHLVQVG